MDFLMSKALKSNSRGVTFLIADLLAGFISELYSSMVSWMALRPSALSGRRF